MATHRELLAAFDTLLEPERYKDYGPNGLQVEGRRDVRLLVSGVTASLALIEAAIAQGADAIVVHHGLFWRGHDGRITGWLRERLARLLAHDVHLYAYHLPLDGHAELGNNAQLARVLGLAPQGRFGEQDLGFIGRPASGEAFADAAALARHVETALGRAATLVAGDDGGYGTTGTTGTTGPVDRIAWCTGGAQGYFESAIAAGAQAYITGEISEPQAHYARECGVAYIACGHHASERYGAPAVAAHVAAQLGIEHRFIDIPNPA